MVVSAKQKEKKWLRKKLLRRLLLKKLLRKKLLKRSNLTSPSFKHKGPESSDSRAFLFLKTTIEKI